MFTKAFVSLSAAKKIAYLAVFTAIAVAVNAFSIDVTPALKLSFTATVGFFVGAMFGPVGGFAVMFTGDLIGCFFSGYAPNPLIGLATGFLGMIPGLIMTHVRGKFYVKAVLSFLLCLIVCTAGLNTFAIYLMSSSAGSVSYWSYMLTRLPVQIPVMAVNTILSILLAKLLNKTGTRFTIS